MPPCAVNMTTGDEAIWVAQAEFSIVGAKVSSLGMCAAGAVWLHRSKMRVGAGNNGTLRKVEARGDWWCGRGCAIVTKKPITGPP